MLLSVDFLTDEDHGMDCRFCLILLLGDIENWS